MSLLKRYARRLVRQKVRKPARAALHRARRRWCPECQKQADLFHVCVIKTDFGRRRAQQERERRGGKPRERRPPHDYRACRDDECRKPVCVAYREGQQACPRPHEG